MSARLVLVRHGQASALSGDYDQLSELGREQARRLGPWLARWAREPAHVLVGPRRRHRETWEDSLATASAEGARWPEPEHAPDLDEHHGIQLVHKLGSELASRPDEIGDLARAAFAPTGDPTRQWLRLFRVLLLAWARGEIGHDEIEPWSAFRSRVARMIESAREREGTILAFTSGGAIGAAVGQVLGLDEARTLDLCWAVRNASITEVHFRKSGATLMTFNGTAHLDREDLVTSV